MKHVVAIYEVGGPVALPVSGNYMVKTSNLDQVRPAVQELVAKQGYDLRACSFATDGRVLAYVVKAGVKKRKRYIAESTLAVKR